MKIREIGIATATAALLFIPLSTASADDDKGVIASEDSAAADNDETIRCKRVPPPVGSRLGSKKVCKTNAAWRLEREAAAEAARETQDRSGTGNTRTSG